MVKIPLTGHFITNHKHVPIIRRFISHYEVSLDLYISIYMYIYCNGSQVGRFPGGHLAMSGNIFGSHVEDTTGI